MCASTTSATSIQPIPPGGHAGTSPAQAVKRGLIFVLVLAVRLRNKEAHFDLEEPKRTAEPSLEGHATVVGPGIPAQP